MEFSMRAQQNLITFFVTPTRSLLSHKFTSNDLYNNELAEKVNGLNHTMFMRRFLRHGKMKAKLKEC
ncbi:CLUMA_CG003040, isoform A [Clunio marinus]|uniref:CLUMA_CG003040, isoform A n=1 Tax=Clunio marinus TaxID=568069 RepID=A0A1J1HSV8_9DIPT|nr:CLUMA_CG003040, isoform A [Clunio marinus]